MLDDRWFHNGKLLADFLSYSNGNAIKAIRQSKTRVALMEKIASHIVAIAKIVNARSLTILTTPMKMQKQHWEKLPEF